MHEVPWSHLIYDSRYSDIVDIYEGGFMHSRGVYRSELNSCMNNDIPYYSTISREAIVKRIMQYAGETYSFEKFVANDKRDVVTETRASSIGSSRSASRLRVGTAHPPWQSTHQLEATGRTPPQITACETVKSKHNEMS